MPKKPTKTKKGEGSDLPLGISRAAWKELSKGQRETLQKIAEWDLSFIGGETMYRMGVNQKHVHKQAVEELKKFLAIKVLCKPRHMGMFGPNVVAAWHSFILNTIEYERFCTDLYGKLIHHVPGAKPDDDTAVWLGIYHSWFGDLPPVWKTDLAGNEIPGMEYKMNVLLAADSDHLDSDNGAY